LEEPFEFRLWCGRRWRLLQTQAEFEFMASKVLGAIEEWHASKDDVVEELARTHTSST
jgi:hypothetical protein